MFPGDSAPGGMPGPRGDARGNQALVGCPRLRLVPDTAVIEPAASKGWGLRSIPAVPGCPRARSVGVLPEIPPAPMGSALSIAVHPRSCCGVGGVTHRDHATGCAGSTSRYRHPWPVTAAEALDGLAAESLRPSLATGGLTSSNRRTRPLASGRQSRHDRTLAYRRARPFAVITGRGVLTVSQPLPIGLKSLSPSHQSGPLTSAKSVPATGKYLSIGVPALSPSDRRRPMVTTLHPNRWLSACSPAGRHGRSSACGQASGYRQCRPFTDLLLQPAMGKPISIGVSARSAPGPASNSHRSACSPSRHHRLLATCRARIPRCRGPAITSGHRRQTPRETPPSVSGAGRR